MTKVRGYIFSRPFMGERVPQSVQNLVIRNYCNNEKLTLLLSATEYAMKNSDLMLFKLLNELNKIDGIVTYSLYQLPESNSRRNFFFEKILEDRKKIYFALERISLQNEKDIDEINILWNIKKIIPLCIG